MSTQIDRTKLGEKIEVVTYRAVWIGMARMIVRSWVATTEEQHHAMRAAWEVQAVTLSAILDAVPLDTVFPREEDAPLMMAVLELMQFGLEHLKRDDLRPH